MTESGESNTPDNENNETTAEDSMPLENEAQEQKAENEKPPKSDSKPKFIFPVILHPFAIAVLPVVKVWETCLGNYLPIQYYMIFTVLALFTLVLIVVLAKLTKDAYKAGMAATLFYAWLYSWIPIKALLDATVSGASSGDESVQVLIYFGIFLALSILILKPLPARKLTIWLNTVIVLVLASSLIPIIQEENAVRVEADKMVAKIDKQFQDIKLTTTGKRPDIYYIVPDAFANYYTLRNLYGYESKLYSHLKKKGFFVADRAWSNHDRTIFSVPSALNMRYMNDVAKEKCARYSEVFFRVLQKNQVSRLLKNLGYRYINVSSGWEPTNYIECADENAFFGLGSNLEFTLFRLTALSAFEERFKLLANLYKSSRMRAFEHAQELKQIKGPKFVFSHLLITHPPFFVDKSGTITSLSKKMMNEPYTKEKYLNQLEFTENQLIKLVDTLLADKENQPIIIIQSDHGPQIKEVAEDPGYVNERMRVFTAFYLPPPVKQTPPRDINQVNTFRWIFNNYFNTKMEMLSPRAYAGIPFKEIRDLKDVTEFIRFPEEKN